MGGSNGGGGGGYMGPYSNRSNEGEDICLTLSFKTSLASVNPDVLSKVNVGGTYDVVTETEKGPAYVMAENKRLGTILHPLDVKMLKCMFEGTEYCAKIILIQGAECQVLISARR